MTCGSSALPMIDIDGGAITDPLARFTKLLESTELPLQIRVYGTRNGYRLLVESQTLSPSGAVFELLARHLSCDVTYRRLCQKQNCFRARLTPKPGQPPSATRVCIYLGTIGRGGICSTLAPLVQFHDDRTGALSGFGELG